MHRGQSITDLETVAAAEKYVCVSRPGQRWAAKTLRSSVSQHSRHSANSAFIPYPGNWVLLPPYSEPPLQLTDKSTLCWSLMDGWTVEEGRGHTLSLHCSGERLRPFVTLLSFNNISDLIPSEGWQVPGTTLSVHSCVSSAWEDSPLDCQQYLLFAQGQWLQIYRAIIVGLCVCVCVRARWHTWRSCSASLINTTRWQIFIAEQQSGSDTPKTNSRLLTRTGAGIPHSQMSPALPFHTSLLSLPPLPFCCALSSPMEIQQIVVSLFQFANHVTSFHNMPPWGIVGRQEHEPRPGPQRADNLSVLL